MYKPKPIKIGGINLPAEVEELVETLASSNHDTWALGKIANGYTMGKKTDDKKKTHKDLIPYEDLSEEIKEYDRQSVNSTIEALYALGYEIRKKNNA